jgi:hypothetical protein
MLWRNAFERGLQVCLTVYRPIGLFPPALKSIVGPLTPGCFVESASEIRVQLPEQNKL